MRKSRFTEEQIVTDLPPIFGPLIMRVRPGLSAL